MRELRMELERRDSELEELRMAKRAMQMEVAR